jgi:prevent-host-death family protein
MKKMPKEISALQIRNNLGEILNRVKYKSDLFLVKRAREPMGVLMGFDEYERLTDLLEVVRNTFGGSKLNKALGVESSQEIEDILTQKRSFVELVSKNEATLKQAGLTVDDLLEELDTQRDTYNQEKYGIKTTSR